MAKLIALEIPPELNKPVTLQIDASGAGDLEDGGTLTAFASSEKLENAEVKVEEGENKIFTLTFDPPTPDKYNLTVKWGEEQISGSLFQLNLNPPNPKQVSIAEPPQSNLKAGQSIGICFETSNAGRGELTASCEGEKVNEVPVEVTRRGISLKYDFKFQPPQEDVYHIAIKYSGKPIKGSPFQLDLVPVRASRVKASEIKMPNGVDGPIEMSICTEGAGNAPLKATCMGSIAGNVPVNVEKTAKHNYNLSVKPPNPDMYTLSVQYGTKHIPNSPFFVNTMPTDASKVEVKEPQNPELGQEVCYKVNTLHAGAGTLSASCTGNRCGEIDVNVSDAGTAKYDVTFTPKHSDTYNVKILWSDKEVNGSPFEMPLYLPPEGYKVKVGELNVPDDVTSDQYVWIELDCSDAGFGEVTGEVKRSEAEEVTMPIEVDTLDLDKYRVKFKPQEADIYTLTIKYGNMPIPGSPFRNINLRGGPMHQRVKHLGTDYPAERGGPIILSFDTQKAGNGEFRARVNGLSTGPTAFEANLVPGSKYTYQVSFTPNAADTYLVDVFWSDKAVPNSPFYVEIIYADKVTAEEPNTVAVYQNVSYKVNTTDAGPGVLKSSCHGETCGEVEVEIIKDHSQNDKYSIHFKPVQEDLYTLSIFFGDVEIQNSPFSIDLRPIVPTKLDKFIGDPLQVMLDNGSLEGLIAEASGEKTGEAEINVTRNNQGYIEAIFDPQLPDQYSVDIKMDGKHVCGSPYVLNYSYPIDASKCCILGLEQLPSTLLIGHEISFCVDATKAGDGILTVAVDGPSTDLDLEPLEVKVTESEEERHVYKIAYTPLQPGPHAVSIQWSSDVVPNAPLLQNIEEPDPTKLDKFIGDPLIVTLDNGSLQGLVADASGERTGDAEINVTRNDQGYIMAMFDPQLPDRYSVVIKMDGKHVCGSPYVLNYTYPIDASKCTSLGLEQLPSVLLIGHEIAFSVDARKAGDGILTVAVDGPSNVDQEPQHLAVNVTESEEEPKVYKISYTPVQLGLHTVNIQWSGEPIPKAPLQQNIEEPDATKLDKFIGDPLLVRLDSGSLEGLVAEASGEQTGDIEIKATRNDQGYIEAMFDPQLPDRYSVVIKMDGKHVCDSPYTLNYTYPIDASKCTILGLAKLPSVLLINQAILFGVDATKAGDGVLTVAVDGPSTDTDLEQPAVEVTESEEQRQMYQVAYTPVQPGLHTINIQWSGESIPKAPLQQSIEAPKPPEKIPIFPLNKPLMFHFTTECDPHDVQAYAIHDDTCNRYVLKIGQGNDGKLKLILRAQLVGIHVVHFLIANKEIHNSPLKVRFVEADPSACKVVDIPEQVYAGEETSFKIDTTNARKADLRILATVPVGGKNMSTTHKDHKNGFYSVMFTPKVAGEHHFKVQWGGTEIPDTPITVNVIEPDSDRIASRQAASKVHILKEDLYVFSKQFPISTPAYFCVATSRAGTGRLTLRARGPGEAKIRVIDRKNGTYTYEVKPSVSGKYLICIYWNEIEIPGSPYGLNYTGMKSYMINGLDLESEKFYLDTPFEFPVQCGNEDGSKLAVSCNPPDIASFELKPQPDSTNNTYMCKIIPKVVGNHEISVKYDDNHILNSPYVVEFHESAQVAGPSDEQEDLTIARPLTPLGLYLDMTSEHHTPMGDNQSEIVAPLSHHVKAYGPGLSDGVIGQEGNFTIETAEGGCGDLEVDVTGLKGTFQVKLRRHPDNDRTILVRYDPTHVGDYTISIKWSGVHIRDSPYTVHIADQEIIPPHEVDEDRSERKEEVELHDITEEEDKERDGEAETEKKDIGEEEKLDEEITKRDDVGEEEKRPLDEQILQQEVVEA